MAQFNVKYTLQFQGPDTTGWGEVYYLSVPGYVTALAILDELCTFRVTILHASFAINYARLSNDLKGVRDSFITTKVLPLFGNLGVAGDTNTPPTQMALQTRVETGPFQRGTKWFHGIPSNQFTGQHWTPTNTFAAFFNTWAGYLIGKPYTLRTVAPKNAPVPGAIIYNPIIDMLPRAWHSRRTGRPFGQLAGRRRPR